MRLVTYGGCSRPRLRPAAAKAVFRQLSNAEAASSPAPAGTAIAMARRALGTICMADAVVNDIHVVFPANAAKEQLGALAAELLSRRDVILDAWRAYGNVVPDARNIAASLSRAQFNDQIPAVLDSPSR